MRAEQPEHCCCIIADPRGRLLLELRPSDARKAPGLLTCYGGKREADEDALACIRRELGEELGWIPEQLDVACDLVRELRFIARFYQATYDGSPLRSEAGRIPVWAHPATLPALPLAPWHRAVLERPSRQTTVVAP